MPNLPKIRVISMYTRELYQAIEAYADDRHDRTKYDAIIEQFVKQANKELDKNESKSVYLYNGIIG